MDYNALIQWAVVVILALVPALLWLRIWKGRKIERGAKKYIFIAFILGAFSALVLLLLDRFWMAYPQFDLIRIISKMEFLAKERVIVLVVFLAVLEEILKFLVVLFIDKSKNLVNSIHDAIRYSIVAALGFAFAENIIYFYRFGMDMELYQFLALFSFRSVITVCGHLVYSGIFGNYYGMSKFSKSFATQSYWGNTKKLDKRSLSDEQLKNKAAWYGRKKILQGLVFAGALHSGFNYFLELEEIANVLWILAGGLVFLIYLYKRQSGYISLLYRRSKMSHMNERDKDVVLEVLGTWYKEGKYLEVIQTCKRLLKKDPTNPVIRLFLNKAIDSQRFIDAYSAVRALFVRKDYLEDFDLEDNNQEEDLKKDTNKNTI